LKFIYVLLAAGLLAFAQETLNNDSVVKMVKSGLGESLIINMIQSQPGKYSLSPDDLVKLKQQGVSENVLSAMVSKNSGANSGAAGASAGTAAASSSASTASSADLPPNLEIGVYYKKAGQWQEMLPEVVTWKSGGVLKTFATNGIVKGDMNGHLQGSNSRNSATSPLEVIIYAPEGVAVTEYQLLHLRPQKDSREFRTMTGGVFHSSGGATRDVVPFEGKRVASRTFRVVLPNLGAGEYGFLPPGAVGSASSVSVGKLYSFRLVE
jgi:hypothetical protein